MFDEHVKFDMQVSAKLPELLAQRHYLYCTESQRKSGDVVREALHQFYERMGCVTR